ncbi:hypothetical protein ACR6HW_16845 [Fusibacter sp. JL298sf-3]
MYKLTYENFMKARHYIYANSDDINRAWFRYNFGENDTNVFMDELAKYQHENGGFGRLNYEFDYQGPCLKSTEHAIEYIVNLKEKPPTDHPVIKNMMKYILEQYHPEIGNWGEPVVPEVNDGVHCHHVRYRGIVIIPIENEDERIKNYEANEKACFAAFVALYSEIVPEELYQDIIKYPIEHILRYWDKNSPDYKKEIFDDGSPYDFDYLGRFVSCLKDKDTANKLTSILCQNPSVFMELDFTKSHNHYVHLPCDDINSPDNIVYHAVKDLVDDSITHRIKQQKNDGRWTQGWSMGEDEGFRKLQILYDANFTMKMLAKFGRFNRIDF